MIILLDVIIQVWEGVCCLCMQRMCVSEKGFKCFGQVLVFWMEFDRTWYEVCCLSPFVIGRVYLEYVGRDPGVGGCRHILVIRCLRMLGIG